MKRTSSNRSRSGAATTRRVSSARRTTPSTTRGGGRAGAKGSRGSSARPASSRSRSNTSRRAIPWPVYVAALLAFALWQFYPAARVEYVEQREKSRLEQQLAQLKQRNTTLRAQVDRLKTPEGVEDLARRKLGYVAPGEHVYVVGSDEATAPAPAVRDETASKPPSTLGGRILDFVFAVR